MEDANDYIDPRDTCRVEGWSAMPLKTLDEFNRDKAADYQHKQRMRQPHANGIACPECGKELWDSDPTFILSSNPPCALVHCPACDYHGHRLA